MRGWSRHAVALMLTVVTHISLDFPHGETRLVVRRDDTALLLYGALPRSQVVRRGTFDIDVVFQALQSRVHDVVPAERRPVGQAYGMVTFRFSDGSEQHHFIYDGAFAEALFQRARANVVGTDP